MSSEYAAPSFNSRAASLLNRIEYRRAITNAEREEIYQLRYSGYVRDGGIEADGSGRFSDAWDNTENVDMVGVYLDSRLIGTVRIHVSDGLDSRIPADEAFGDVVRPYHERGQKLVDATRFVTDQRPGAFCPELPFLTLRAVAMAAEYYEAFGLLAAVRKEHAVVYRRVTGHRPISEPRSYPLLRKPIVCMLARTADLDALPYRKHPFLRSTVQERARLFDRTAPFTLPRPDIHSPQVAH